MDATHYRLRLILFTFFFYISCEKSDISQVAKSDIIGTWRDIDTSFLKITNPETMISAEHKIVEVYDLRADNRFEIKDKDIFQFCDRGQYILNSELNTIEFTCDSITVEIAGHPIKLPSGAKKRMWKIEKIIEDSLFVKVFNHDDVKDIYFENFKKRYLKVK
jgi:hypothetical protein